MDRRLALIIVFFVCLGLVIDYYTNIIGIFRFLGEKTKTISTSGVVKRFLGGFNSGSPNEPPNADVYADAGASTLLTSVDWGEINVGGSKTIYLYVKNHGSPDFIVTFFTENWVPKEAEQYLTLTANETTVATKIVAREVRKIDLTLHVSPSTTNITSFSFDIVVGFYSV